MDGQEFGAYNVWIRNAPDAHQTSVNIPHSGPLDPTTAKSFGPFADRHGFYMSDRGNGVSLIAKRPADGGPQTKTDTAGLLEGELGQGIQEHLPGAIPTPTRFVSDILAGIGRPPGKGQATKAWLDTLDRAPPEAIEGLGRSGLVRDIIAGLHARDARLHGTMGPEGAARDGAERASAFAGRCDAEQSGELARRGAEGIPGQPRGVPRDLAAVGGRTGRLRPRCVG